MGGEVDRAEKAGREGGKQLVWILLLFIGFSKDIMISRLPGAAWPARGPSWGSEARVAD